MWEYMMSSSRPHNSYVQNHFTPGDQGKSFNKCVTKVGERIYRDLGLPNDPRGRYVIAMLARQEFQDSNRYEFAYKPMPAVDRDMHIIHEGLQKTLEAGMLSPEEKTSAFFIEKVFFRTPQGRRFRTDAHKRQATTRAGSHHGRP